MATASTFRSWFALAGFIAASFVTGAIGSWATIVNVRAWYPLLNKPTWNPPGWIFGPVWSLLYVLMGVAIWRVWRTGNKENSSAIKGAVAVYFVQLVFNALWSVLFFGLKKPGWALADISVLWFILVGLLIHIWRIERIAGLLWLPYVLWVSFATVLNTAIVRLN